MKRKQHSHPYRSILLFAASLLIGVAAIEEFGISSASAQTPPGCKLTFDAPFWWGSGGESDGVRTAGTFHCNQLPYPNSMDFTLELWVMKFNPRTGGNDPTLVCSEMHSVQQAPENVFNYTCPHVRNGDTVQVRGKVTGYDGRGHDYSVEDSTDWITLRQQ